MAVVVSDTTPLHYLILIGRESILERLYGKVFIPPAVLTELSHAAAPGQISNWAALLPTWVTVAAPRSMPAWFDRLDFGERQALALAKEMRADLVLLDDKAARQVARRELMTVKGTLGIVAAAAKANLLDFVQTVEQLQDTNMRLGQGVIDEILSEYRLSQQKKKS
jgi:predicted nucleic acid-binding protein